MTVLGLQEPTPLVNTESGESAVGKTKILSIEMAGSLRRFVPWVMKAGLAILDQGLYAGSNFIISVLLARWLSPEQYGSYAVAFAVFVFILMFHQALMLEPMLVFGSSSYRNCLREYLKALLFIHLGISVLVVAGLGISAGVAMRLGQSNGLSGALVGVALAAPTILMLWIIKRFFYLKLSPAPSACASLVYCTVTMGGLALVYHYNCVSPLSTFLLMGVGSVVASVVLLIFLASKLSSSEDAPKVMDIWRRHWRYGRWAMGANVMMWVPLNVFYPMLSSLSGMAEAGELKALMNFASPMYQTSAALSPLMLPYAGRVFGERGHAGASPLLRLQTLLSISYTIPYWIVLLLFQGPIFRLLYSGRYTEVGYLMPIVALACVFGSAFFGPANVLRVMESPGLVFAAVSISSGVAVAIGVPMTWALGLKGAVWSMALSEALAFFAAVAMLRRKSRKLSEAALVVTCGAPLAEVDNES